MCESELRFWLTRKADISISSTNMKRKFKVEDENFIYATQNDDKG